MDGSCEKLEDVRSLLISIGGPARENVAASAVVATLVSACERLLLCRLFFTFFAESFGYNPFNKQKLIMPQAYHN